MEIVLNGQVLKASSSKINQSTNNNYNYHIVHDHNTLGKVVSCEWQGLQGLLTSRDSLLPF